MYQKSTFALVLCAAVSLLLPLSGCGGGSGGGANSNPAPIVPVVVTPASLALAPVNSTLEAGRTLVVTARAADAAGTPLTIPNGNWIWSSSDNTIASSAPDGSKATLTARKAGTVTITAKEGYSGVTASTTLTVIAAPPAAAASPAVYLSAFENGAGPEWSKRTVDITPGTPLHAPTAFLGQFGAEPVSLTLTNLPAHTSTTVECDLFILRSMDGNGAADVMLAPDVWELSIEGGPSLLKTTFSNISPELARGNYPYGYPQAYPDLSPGGNHPYLTGAAEVNTLGFPYKGAVHDAVYHLKFTFPHTAASVKLNFTGANDQDITDESWGLTHVKVTQNP